MWPRFTSPTSIVAAREFILTQASRFATSRLRSEVFVTEAELKKHLDAAEKSPKQIGCGYFLATRKAPKNQVILDVAAAEMTGNSRVIEERKEYPRV